MKTFIEPILFSTRENTSYFYDDVSQQVFQLQNKKELEQITSIINRDITIDEIRESRLYTLYKNYNLFYRDIPNIDNRRYINHSKNKGIRQLILEVTADCNLRCKYCFFSEYYSDTRELISEKLSFNDAKKALDYFFNFNIESLKKNPLITPAITFYGGEPLIDFPLVKDVVKYIDDNYRSYFTNITYSLTTNGLLLNKDNISFLLNNNFLTHVSLDGCKEANDRNRVTINQKGSFDIIYKNLLLFDEMEREYSLDYKIFKFSILSVFDFKDSIDRRVKDMMADPLLSNRLRRITFVDQENTSFYDDMDFKTVTRDSSNKLWDIYSSEENSKSKEFVNRLYNESLVVLKSRILHQQKVLKGCCIPGYDKIYVSVDGKYHMCEKGNQNHPIGSIEYGLNEKTIEKHLDFITELHKERCHSCSISNLCDVCYKHFETEDENFQFKEDVCERQLSKHTGLLGLYYSKKEFDKDTRI